MAERSLHKELKAHYADAQGVEVRLPGGRADALQGEVAIEVQTGSFTNFRRKIERLLDERPVLIVHPVSQIRYIRRLFGDGQKATRRRSPKRSGYLEAFGELVRLAPLLGHPNLAIEVALVEEEVLLVNDGRGSWRRRHWSILDHRLVRVIETRRFDGPPDFLALIPADLPEPFTNHELAEALGARVWLVQRMTYCLRRMGALEVVGKRGNSLLHRRG